MFVLVSLGNITVFYLVHGTAVSFGIGDYLHVMERYDPNWWIGRKVKKNKS